jgi:flagellar hook-associated protein FlgK
MNLYQFFCGDDPTPDSSVHEILERLEIMATTLDQLKTDIATLKSDTAAEAVEVSTALQGLRDQIKSLQDQIAAGTVVTQADLDALDASVVDADTAVKAISGAPVA